MIVHKALRKYPLHFYNKLAQHVLFNRTPNMCAKIYYSHVRCEINFTSKVWLIKRQGQISFAYNAYHDDLQRTTKNITCDQHLH